MQVWGTLRKMGADLPGLACGERRLHPQPNRRPASGAVPVSVNGVPLPTHWTGDCS